MAPEIDTVRQPFMPPRLGQECNHKCLNVLHVMFLIVQHVHQDMKSVLQNGNTQGRCTRLLTAVALPNENPKRNQRRNDIKLKTTKCLSVYQVNVLVCNKGGR